MEETLRVLVALAITVFLVILRFEAEDFGAAEYDEPTRDGHRASLPRRLSWTVLGFALVGALLAGVRAGQVQQYDENTVAFGRAVMLEVSNVYALRMAGVFMVSLGTIWLRTGLMPRSFAVLTYALAAVLLFVTSLSLWVTMVFPAWVLAVSVGIIVRTRRGESAVRAAPEPPALRG